MRPSPDKSADSKNAIAAILSSILSPLKQFVKLQSASGLVLLATTIIALIWANSNYSAIYFDILKTTFGFKFGAFEVFKSLEHWINDGLMVIFFFVVGVEIKKEFCAGELSDRKRAALPIIAALGGMVVPAIIYAFFNINTATANGWGIPMATDIAFAVGVLTLLGNRVPFALTVFLLALAIVDDLGAVLVIAFFYTAQLSLTALVWALSVVLAIVLLNKGGVRSRIAYVLLGIAVWFAILKSGVHATIAGVILGFLTPIKPRIDKDHMRGIGFNLLRDGEEENIAELRDVAYEALSPADNWIRLLNPWVSFLIMPLFALANAGVRFEGFNFSSFLAAPVSLGIFFGLVLGKPIGIFLFSWLGCKLGWAERPTDTDWRQILGVAALGGIGFTMALFIGQLSLTDQSAGEYAKLAILLGSLCAAILGTVILICKSRSFHSKARQ
jgi:Na+:H+ antiporter, NhaA family